MALRENFHSPVSFTDPVKVSKNAVSLHMKKIFFLEGCRLAVSDVISGGLLDHLGPLGPGYQPLGISLKFLLETRLQSKPFDTLDDLLRFRVQKL